MLGAALRFGFGTATLLGGGWVLRALHGTPAALGAGPGDIRAVAQRSPHFHDGVFANVDPTSPINLDREQQRLLIRELVGSRSEGRPRGPIPVAASMEADVASAGLAVCWYGHSTALVEVDPQVRRRVRSHVATAPPQIVQRMAGRHATNVAGGTAVWLVG